MGHARTERLIAAIAGRQEGAISRRQLRFAGLGEDAIEHRVRTHRLFRVLPRVYALTPTLSPRGRAVAALLAAGADRGLVVPDATPPVGGPRRTASRVASLSAPPVASLPAPPVAPLSAPPVASLPAPPVAPPSAPPVAPLSPPPVAPLSPPPVAPLPAPPSAPPSASPAASPVAPLPAATRHAVGLDPDILLSHWTVLWLTGIVGAPRAIDVTTIGGVSRCRSAGVTGHRAVALHPDDRQLLLGLPAVGVARSILDVAPRATTDRLAEIVREAQMRRLLTPRSLGAAIERAPRHRGIAALERADPDLLETLRSESPLAGDLARFLREELEIGPWVVEHPVVSPTGRRYRFDHAHPPLRLAVEADGRLVHTRPDRRGEDADRDADMAAEGWVTVRVTARQLRDPSRLRTHLRGIAAQQARRWS